MEEISKRSQKDLGRTLEELKIEARGDKAFLPHFEKPRWAGEEKDYPFHLINYKLMTMAEGRGANQPYLQEIIGPHLYERWDSWVEINPKTADNLGIKDGDLVWVESPAGKSKAKARLFPGTHPNCIHIAYGQGHKKLMGGVAFYLRRPATTQTLRLAGKHKPMSADAALLRLVIIAGLAFVAFRVAQPYAFVGTNFELCRWEEPEYDWLRANVPDVWYTLHDKLPESLRSLPLPDPRFISTLGSVNKQLTGEADVPWGHQWTNRLPFVFPWVNMVVWGMGLPMGLVAWAGVVLAAWQTLRALTVRSAAHLAPRFTAGTVRSMFARDQGKKVVEPPVMS